MFKNNSLLLVLIFSLLISCNKDDSENIPTGENTAYFYVNGELVVATDSEDPAIVFGQTPESFQIRFFNEDLLCYLEMAIGNELALGVFNLGNADTSENVSVYYIMNENSGWEVFFSNDNSGSITITSLSEDKKKFKGTFETDVYDSNGEVKHITNGHFNINLETLDN